MLFNSLEFSIFLPIVFTIYWLLNHKGLKLQNLFILVCSYFFYGWWDWKYLILIFISTVVDFSLGILIYNENKEFKRNIFLSLSLVVNLGFLCFFKYFNFFIESFISLSNYIGLNANLHTIKIILPVGISFYTFQTLSYTIDIYRNKLKPSKDFVNFAAYVSFFPQLVAGPIERATHLLPQFEEERVFDYKKAVDGLRQILWGLFKKIAIADMCSEFVNVIFSNTKTYNGSTLLIGAVLFSFQIYGDFSGYSDIAIGTARLFGFNLMKNFSFPYFSRDIAEFWRRWHISLSTWFRDYIYVPLGGSRCKLIMKVRNTFIIFIVSGFWHGANWTFLIWGGLNALYFLPSLISNSNRRHLDIVASNKKLPSIKELFLIIKTFLMVSIAWIFFRANSVEHSIKYFKSMINLSLFSKPQIFNLVGITKDKVYLTFLLLLLFIMIEWLGRQNEYAIERIRLFRNQKLSRVFCWMFYYFIIFSINFTYNNQSTFIYFQF